MIFDRHRSGKGLLQDNTVESSSVNHLQTLFDGNFAIKMDLQVGCHGG